MTHSSSLNFIPELQNEAKQLELLELEKYRLTPVCISKLDNLLNDLYAIRRPKSIDYHNRRDLIRIFNAIARELYGNFSFLSLFMFMSVSSHCFHPLQLYFINY